MGNAVRGVVSLVLGASLVLGTGLRRRLQELKLHADRDRSDQGRARRARQRHRQVQQSQLEGLNRAKRELGIQTLPLQSNATSDYVPNFTQAVAAAAQAGIWDIGVDKDQYNDAKRV